MFDKAWSNTEVKAALAEYLPIPFQYLRQLPGESSSCSEDEDGKVSGTRLPVFKSQWLVLVKERNRLAVYPNASHPDGEDIAACSITKKSNLQSQNLYLGRFPYVLIFHSS